MPTMPCDAAMPFPPAPSQPSPSINPSHLTIDHQIDASSNTRALILSPPHKSSFEAFKHSLETSFPKYHLQSEPDKYLFYTPQKRLRKTSGEWSNIVDTLTREIAPGLGYEVRSCDRIGTESKEGEKGSIVRYILAVCEQRPEEEQLPAQQEQQEVQQDTEEHAQQPEEPKANGPEPADLTLDQHADPLGTPHSVTIYFREKDHIFPIGSALQKSFPGVTPLMRSPENTSLGQFSYHISASDLLTNGISWDSFSAGLCNEVLPRLLGYEESAEPAAFITLEESEQGREMVNAGIIPRDIINIGRKKYKYTGPPQPPQPPPPYLKTYLYNPSTPHSQLFISVPSPHITLLDALVNCVRTLDHEIFFEEVPPEQSGENTFWVEYNDPEDEIVQGEGGVLLEMVKREADRRKMYPVVVQGLFLSEYAEDEKEGFVWRYEDGIAEGGVTTLEVKVWKKK